MATVLAAAHGFLIGPMQAPSFYIWISYRTYQSVRASEERIIQLSKELYF